MRIIVDAMGGDNAPEEIVIGSVNSVNRHTGFDIVLVGDTEKINAVLANQSYPADRISIKHASEVISTEEAPVQAVKKKKDSSMVVGLEMLKAKEGDAFVSAGSTGALLTGALLRVGRIRGVQRPALSPVLPNNDRGFLLLDSGANMDCKPLYLEQFAVMGSVYMEKVLGFNNPKVGLINVGVEEEKGNDLTKTVHAMLKENKTINFMGNVEARELMTGDVEVAVCDGFAGNLCLKTAEGMGSFIFKLMKENMTKGFRNKLGALLLKPALKELKKKFDYSEYGGAPLLGIDGVVIKAHGSTDAKITEITIMQAVNMVEKDIISVIKTNIEALNNTDEN